MRIYINGRFLTQRTTGVQKYAREIVCALDTLIVKRENNNEWILLIPKGTLCDMPITTIEIKKCGCLQGHMWEQLELPYYAKDGFLINLCNCAPLVKKNQLITIHDAAIAAYPHAYSWKFRVWYQIIYKVCGKRLKNIITVSEFSRNEINKYFSIPLYKIHVINNGIDHMDRIKDDKEILTDLKIHRKEYVLAVSSRNPTKNFKLILNAAKRIKKIKFVIVGGSNNNVFAHERLEKLENVIYTGYINDEKLLTLYKNAAVFVYPSLYEGFGIPPLEAMSQGCPSVVSNRASLPEVCGNYALYCDPYDVDDLVTKIVTLFDKEQLLHRDLISVKNKYLWRNSAKKLLQYINC